MAARCSAGYAINDAGNVTHLCCPTEGMMPKRPVSGDAITVLGPVAANALGITLPHEHLLIRVPDFIEFDEVTLKQRQEEPVTLENLGWIRQYWTYNKDNLRLTSEELAANEARR